MQSNFIKINYWPASQLDYNTSFWSGILSEQFREAVIIFTSCRVHFISDLHSMIAANNYKTYGLLVALHFRILLEFGKMLAVFFMTSC